MTNIDDPPCHIALLGDSIFDNAAYVAGGPDTLAQLRMLLPPGSKATLCAVDGHVASQLPTQLASVPPDATHLVLSLGGNDALGHEYLLREPVSCAVDLLLQFASALDRFELEYGAAIRCLLGLDLPLMVCTIYNADFADPMQARCVRVAVALFNDVIARTAHRHGLPVIELRELCTEPADYANDIEPSSQGSRKIAAAITSMLDVRR